MCILAANNCLNIYVCVCMNKSDKANSYNSFMLFFLKMFSSCFDLGSSSREKCFIEKRKLSYRKVVKKIFKESLKLYKKQCRMSCRHYIFFIRPMYMLHLKYILNTHIYICV